MNYILTRKKKKDKVEKIVEKAVEFVGLAGGLAIAVVGTYFRVPLGGDILSAIMSIAAPLSGKIVKKIFHAKYEKNRKQIVEEFLSKMDVIVEKITKEKFQKIKEIVNITLRDMDDNVSHYNGILEKLQKEDVFSEQALFCLSEFFEISHQLEKIADKFAYEFL